MLEKRVIDLDSTTPLQDRFSMKPWRPYWNQCSFALDELLKTQANPPFTRRTVVDWIGNLSFGELSYCDDCMYSWFRYPQLMPHAPLIGETSSVYWQAILRFECAVAFCKGQLGKRSEYDWNKPAEHIYKFRVFELWYRNASYWANRTFGDHVTEARYALHREVVRRMDGALPEAN